MTRINCVFVINFIQTYLSLNMFGMKNLTQNDFKDRLRNKNKYFESYFNLIGEFKNCRTKILVSTPHGNCLVHPYSLLECDNKPSIQSALNKINFFVSQAKEIHGNKYDYSLINNYKNNITKIPIICSEHGVFYQTPNNHLNGCGCSKCGLSSWDFKLSDWLNTKNEHAVFYILKCFNDNEEFIKIGITSTGIAERYRKDMPYKYDVIHETKSSNKKFIWDLERKFKRELKKHKYNPSILFGGYTECYDVKSLKQIQISHV